MNLLDVNVLVYAFRIESPRHGDFQAWLTKLSSVPEAFSVSDLAFSGFLRVVTHPKAFDPPAPLDLALKFVDDLRTRPNFRSIAPGPRHWELFVDLCRKAQANGNLVPDAYHAALAIEQGCTWVTTDRDFARFPGLRWRHPLEG